MSHRVYIPTGALATHKNPRYDEDPGYIAVALYKALVNLMNNMRELGKDIEAKDLEAEIHDATAEVPFSIPGSEGNTFWNSDEGDYVIENEILPLAEEYATPGTYFGCRDGRVGFWEPKKVE